MPTMLAVPLDDWVCATARPIQNGALNDSYAPGTRRDYSKLTVEDAFPLLIQACWTRFGSLEALDFGLKESNGPLTYSSALTVTSPEEIGIEFPNSGRHPTAITAKMHAAHRAIQQGVIEFIMQSGDSTSTSPRNSSRPLSSANPPNPPNPPNPLDPKELVTQAVPPPKSPVSRRAPLPTRSIPARSGLGSSPHPVSIINERLQKAYRGKNLRAGAGLICKGKQYPDGYLASLTIKLPSGRTKTYGSLPGNPSANGRSLQLYPSAKDAKRAAAALAIQNGVLDFISSEDTSGGLAAPAPIPAPAPAPAPQPKPSQSHGPLPSYLGLSSYVAFDPGSATTPTAGTTSPSKPGPDQARTESPSPGRLPPKPWFLPPRPLDTSVLERRSSSPLEPEVGPDPSPNNSWRNNRVYASMSPVGDAQVVDDLLGAALVSRPPSSGASNGVISDEGISSPLPSNDNRLPGSGNGLEEEEEQSEPMDLETDAGTGTRANSPVVSSIARKVPLEMEVEKSAEEPPRKKQRTEPPSVDEKVPEIGEAKVMAGTTYASILSDYCAGTGQPQPHVTYQRHRDDSVENGSVLYHVSLVIGTGRYELSKNYENVQSAEEKLSKRILKLFGVNAKKA